MVKWWEASDVALKAAVAKEKALKAVDAKEKAQDLEDDSGFPYQLSPLGTKVSLPIPAEPFHGKAPSLKKIFNADIKIYVTPDEYFTTKFREIFQKTKLRHTSAVESKHWLAGPDMKYWPQQLNFAVFCATQRCGVSREIFDSGLDLPPQIREFYVFHVYFTVMRILYQTLYLKTLRSTRKTIITTSLHTKGYVQSLVLTRQAIFDSHEGQTTVWGVYTLVCQGMERRKQECLTPVLINSAMKVGQQAKGT